MEIAATGREQTGQSAFDFAPPNGNNRDYPFTSHRVHPNDLQALCNYTQRFGYDAVGNIESWMHRARGEGWTRHYDYEETSLIESDKTNNRLTRTRVGDSFDQIENYAHDVHGNMISMPHLPGMTWDSEDRLREVNLGGGGIAYYVYDAAGQRVRKVIESQNGTRRKERFYLGGFELYREYEPDGQTVSLERESIHVMDDSRRIALVETQTVGNSDQLIRYQLGNHLGSASLELDENGELISYEEYHPYGTTSFQAGRSAAEVSLKRYRYTAKERDEESGFNYHGARYYAPWLARWTSADPAGMVDGTNLYEYVRANPIRYLDLTGFQGEEPNICSKDPNNPRNYLSFEAFAQGAIGSWTDEGIRAEWAQAHASVSEQKRGPLPQTAGSGAVTIYNTIQRSKYISQIKLDSEGAIRAINAAQEAKNLSAAESASRGASEARNTQRTATQKRLSPGSRYMSEVLEEARDFDSLVQDPKYARSNPFDTYRNVADAAGRSRKSIKLLTRLGKVAGPLGTAVGLGVAGYEIVEASPEERSCVVARESSGIVGGAVGAEIGMAGGTAAGVAIAGALGLSGGPPGWLVLGLALLGGLGGGYLGSETGRVGGEALHNAATSSDEQRLNGCKIEENEMFQEKRQ